MKSNAHDWTRDHTGRKGALEHLPKGIHVGLEVFQLLVVPMQSVALLEFGEQTRNGRNPPVDG